MRLLRLALAGEVRCAVDDQEIARGGISYSIDSVRNYAARFPGAKLFYLLGADQVPSLGKWRDAAALAELVDFLIIPRPGEPVMAPPRPFRAHELRGFPLRLSASQIRERIRLGLPIQLLTPPAVAEAIRHNRLYL